MFTTRVKEGHRYFNLLEGKMRSVVGKTKLQIHTPTAVAAARGTVIFFRGWSSLWDKIYNLYMP